MQRTLLPICLMLVVLALAAHGRVCTGGFEFINADDDEYVTENAHVRSGLTRSNIAWAFTAFYSYNWHPLTWLSLQLDHDLYGLDPQGFHITNVLLHVLNSLLLYLVLQRMTGCIWPNAAVAAFFAVHPLHVESVAWIAERKDVLCAFFWLLTLLAYAEYAARPGIKRYLLVVLGLVLALMSKPMAVTLPAVLLLLDYWPLRRWRQVDELPGRFSAASLRWLLLEKLPLLVVVAGACVLTVLAQRGAVRTLDEIPVSIRLLNAVNSYAGYLGKMVWPTHLAFLYPHPGANVPTVQIATAAAVLASMTGLAVWRARGRPYLIVGWLWYLGTLVPVIGLVQVGTHAMADRYTYLPLIGIFVAIGWSVADLCRRFERMLPLVGVVTAGLIVAATVVTWNHLQYWRNSIALWQHTLDVTSDNANAHQLLGMAYVAENKTDLAVEQFTAAVRIKPRYSKMHNNLAMVLVMQGKDDAARKEFERAVELDPSDAVAHTNLATFLTRQGELELAQAHFFRSLELKEDDAGTHYNLGGLYMKRGQIVDARRHYERAVAIDPLRPEMHDSLGTALSALALFKEAIASYRHAVRLKPEHAAYHCNLAYALDQDGQSERCRLELQAALQIDPQWPFRTNQAAWQLATSRDARHRDGPAAVRLARQCLLATGDLYPEPLDTLSAAYAEAGDFPNAIRTAGQARQVALAAGKTQLAEQIAERVRGYEGGKPYRARPDRR